MMEKGGVEKAIYPPVRLKKFDDGEGGSSKAILTRPPLSPARQKYFDDGNGGLQKAI